MNTLTTETAPHYGRGFYVAWFALFTVISMALNGLHAFIAAPRAWAAMDPSITEWLAVGAAMPTWLAVTAVAVSQIPPVALACATNALVKPDPDTTSGRGTAARSTTWTIAAGAFVLSAIAMTDLTRMLLGVPVLVAAIMPIIVDVSIVAAVLRLEIRRASHRVEAHVPEVLDHPNTEVGATASGVDPSVDQAREPAVTHPVNPSVSLDRAESVDGSTARGHGPVNPKPVTRAARPVSQPATPISDHADAAARLVSSGRTTLSADVIEHLLRVRDTDGMSAAVAATGVPMSTAKRTVRAARELSSDIDQDDAAGDRPEPRVLTAV